MQCWNDIITRFGELSAAYIICCFDFWEHAAFLEIKPEDDG